MLRSLDLDPRGRGLRGPAAAPVEDDLSIGPVVVRVGADLLSRYLGLFAVVVALLLVATLMPSRVLREESATASAPPAASGPAAAPKGASDDEASCPSIPGPVPTAPAGVAATLLGLASPLLTALGPFSAGAIPLLGVISPLLDIIAPIAGRLQPFLDSVYPRLVEISEAAAALWAGPLAEYVPRLMEINETAFLPFVRRLLDASAPIVEAIDASDVIPCLQIVVTRLAGGPATLGQP